MNHPKAHGGFTIVELLIAIVVIAIISAITIVTYRGITQRTYTSSLQADVAAMDKAQKRYISLTGGSALESTEDGTLNDILSFASNKGNTVVVRLKSSASYCVYGYNPQSPHRTAATAFTRSSDGEACAPLSQAEAVSPNAVYSTVAIIGQRLQAFYNARGAYPLLAELVDIGLVIKPNSSNAQQQQLYCRNDAKAIYLQRYKSENIIYVYDTATNTIIEPTNLNKLSLKDTCPVFDIKPNQPGYESTGIKEPDI